MNGEIWSASRDRLVAGMQKRAMNIDHQIKMLQDMNDEFYVIDASEGLTEVPAEAPAMLVHPLFVDKEKICFQFLAGISTPILQQGQWHQYQNSLPCMIFIDPCQIKSIKPVTVKDLPAYLAWPLTTIHLERHLMGDPIKIVIMKNSDGEFYVETEDVYGPGPLPQMPRP